MKDPFSIAKADFAQCYEALLASAARLREVALDIGIVVAAKQVLELPEDCALPRVRRVQRIVCERFGMSLEQLLCKRRSEDYVLLRHAAIYVCRQVTGYSLERLGEAFQRDHGSIIYAVSALEARMEQDAKLKLKIEALLITAAEALKAA